MSSGGGGGLNQAALVESHGVPWGGRGPAEGAPSRAIAMDRGRSPGGGLAFRDARDWAQFHQPSDLALALDRAAEVLELFRFKSDAEVRAVEKRCHRPGHERPTFYWVLCIPRDRYRPGSLWRRNWPSMLGAIPSNSRGRKEKYTILHGYQEAAEPTGESLPEEDPDEPDPPVLKPTLMPGGPRRKVAPLLRRSGDCAEDSGSGLESAGAPASPA